MNTNPPKGAPDPHLPRSGRGRPWLIVQHLEAEGPGLIAAALRARGWPFEIRQTNRRDALPAADSIAGLIVMGGPMGVYEADRYPFLAAETALLRDAMRLGRPILGVCLGAQLLAAALGATVSRGPVLEIGAGEVTLTAAGNSDAVLGPGAVAGRLRVVHWHRDTISLPERATLLASSPLYPHQAFSVGRDVYGLQFHVEVDRELAAGWASALPPGAALAAADIEQVAGAGRGIIDRYLDLAGAG